MHDSLSLYEIEDGLRVAVDAYEEAREQLELVANEPAEVNNAAYDRMMLAQSAVEAYLQEEIRKVNGIHSYIRYCDAMQRACDEEAERLEARQKMWERRRDWIKGLVLSIMRQFDVKKFETASAVLRRQNNGGVNPVEITDPAAVPAHFVRVTVQMTEAQFQKLPMMVGAVVKEREFMNAAIRKTLETGSPVPGARLGERGESLRVA